MPAVVNKRGVDGNQKGGTLSSRQKRAVYILAQRIDLCHDIFYSARILISNHTFSQQIEIFGYRFHPFALLRKNIKGKSGRREKKGRAKGGREVKSGP